MTTHNTHHEHNDADASVVEYPSAPENETTANSVASETDASSPTHVETNSSLDEQTSSAHAEEIHTQETDHSSTSEDETLSASAEVPEQLEIETAPSAGNPEQTSSTATFEEAVVVNNQDAGSSSFEAPENLVGDDQEAAVSTPADAGSPEPVVGSVAEETVHATRHEVSPTEISLEHVTQDEPVAEVGLSAEANADQSSSSEEATDVEAQSAVAEVVETPLTEEFAAFTAVQGEAAVPEPENAQPQTPAESVAEVQVSTVQSEEAVQAEAKAEEVRPFTDFIAEFRQAEAALQATLRDTQAEAFSLLSSAAADLVDGEGQAIVEPIINAISSEIENSSAEILSLTSTADELQKAASEKEVEQTDQPKEEQKPVTRPVSPLLRPASRLRMPRHTSRHTREEVAQPAPADEASTPEATTTSATETPVAPAETVEEQTPPRPARRYRFDRPAVTSSTTSTVSTGGSTNGTETSSSAPTHTSRVTAQKSEEKQMRARSEENKAIEEQPSSSTQLEVVSKKQATTPEVESASATPTQTAEHGRRRHTKEKEQVAQVTQEQTPAVEATVPVPEPAVPVEEVAPEDLPPLEYSELQKASSRRRRRHRSSSNASASASAASASNGNAPVSVSPVTPSPQTPAASVPQTPAQPAANNNGNAYSIVSGYTVSQMNQGNELSGPFMAPDPSPARGSVLIRDGRTTRAEMRPTPPSQLYPPAARSGEGGLSTAAMTQFANIVSQALQLQTDRMVAEFRRMSQTPTNVSVTLPPFPSTERVGVFVDVANLLYSARTLRMGVDFGKLLDFLRGNRRLVRAHAYCPTSPQAGDEQMFLQAVKGLGYRITTKNYKTFSSGAKKADLDLDLCMDVVRLVDGGAVDCVVLVSGDSDFMPMLDYCSDHGVRVEVAAFDEAMSATLRQSCDLFINLSMLEEIRA